MEIPQALPHWSQSALPKPQIGLLHDLLKTFNSFPLLLGRWSPTSFTGLQDLVVSCPYPLSGNSPNPDSTVTNTRHMHKSTYVHMHTQTYTLVYMSTHTHTHAHTCTHKHKHMHMNTVYIHKNKCTYRGLIRPWNPSKHLASFPQIRCLPNIPQTFLEDTYTHAYTYIHRYTQHTQSTYTHTCSHTCTRIHKYAQTHMHTVPLNSY